MFANGPRDQGSIPGRVIPKTQKMVLDAALLNTHYYKVRLKGKLSNPGNGVALFPTLRCSSYWKGSLRITINFYWILIILMTKPLSYLPKAVRVTGSSKKSVIQTLTLMQMWRRILLNLPADLDDKDIGYQWSLVWYNGETSFIFGISCVFWLSLLYHRGSVWVYITLR